MARARLGTRVTPAHSSPIVGAHARGFGELRLNPLPIQHGTAGPEIHYDGRCSFCFSRAIEVQGVAAHGDQFSGRRISAFVDPGDDELEYHTREQQNEDQPHCPDDTALRPPPEPTTFGVHCCQSFPDVVVAEDICSFLLGTTPPVVGRDAVRQQQSLTAPSLATCHPAWGGRNAPDPQRALDA
jgi:hypothetical protein